MAKIFKRCPCSESQWASCLHQWVVRYRTTGGRSSRQHEQSFGTDLREAEDFALKVEHDKRAHVFVNPKGGRVLFREAAGTWLDQHLGADSSIATYRSVRRSGAQFGLSDQQWDAAKAEVREAILEAAYDRRMTWYGEVASSVSAVPLDPYSALMNHLLGAVFEDERAAGRPALTSIVTHKYGDKEPGGGFYEMARSLGYQFREPYIFWAQQVQDVFKLYGKP